MNFEWDEEKRRRNLEKHGIDFARVLPVFDSLDALIIEDEGKDYGERRFILLCPLDTVLIHVTFTYRDDANPHHLSPARRPVGATPICKKKTSVRQFSQPTDAC